MVVGTLVADGSSARAADTAPATTATTAGSPAPAAGSGTTAATDSNGEGAKAAPTRPATGYGFGDDKPARSAPPARHHVAHRPGAPIVTLPGFEMLADGGSRLFVQVSKNVEVAEQKGMSAPAHAAKGKAGKGKGSTTTAAHPTITYVLKGAQVLRRNNQNALVTVHFNTPVARARLIPTGRDVRFVVDLRADTAPTFKVVAAKENSAILQIDFPKGDFLPNGADDTPEPVSPDAPKVFEKDDTQ